MFLPHQRVKVSIVGSLCDREVACSGSDRQGSNFESCAWRTVSSQSSHHPQEVLLAQFSLYVHKRGLKLDSFRMRLCVQHTVRLSFTTPAGTCAFWTELYTHKKMVAHSKVALLKACTSILLSTIVKKRRADKFFGFEIGLKIGVNSVPSTRYKRA